jgi:hypothetical protein
MTKTAEEGIYIGCQWFMALGAIILLVLFSRYTIGYFQSPYYDFGQYMNCTVWDSIWKNGFWSPAVLGMRLFDAWFQWTFVTWYTPSVLDMHLGLMTIPFWGFWIWIGLNWWRGIGCI